MKNLLKSSDLAARLNLKESTIRRMTRDGRIPAIKVGNTKRYDLDAVLKALGITTEG